MNFAEYVAEYREQGLSFFSVPYKSKQSVIEWKTYQERLPTEAEISQWINGPNTNIAVVCGKVSDNLVVLDCDSEQKFSGLASTICRNIGIDDIRDFTRISKTSKGFHIWLRTKEPIKSQKFPQLDIKGEGGYIIAPPSVHPTGAVYQFINDKPIVRVDNLKLIGIDVESKSDAPRNEPGWVSQWLATGVGEGQRNDATAKLAGFFRNTLPQDVTERILLDWNTRNTPPLPERELLQVIASVYRKPEHTSGHQYTGYNNIYFSSNAPAKQEIASTPDKNLTKTLQKPDTYAKAFDDFMRGAGGPTDKKELALTIGLQPTSDTFYQILTRRRRERKIRAYRGSAHLIEWVNRDYKPTDLSLVEVQPMLNIQLPLRLHEYVKIPPRSIIGVAGETSSGKSAFLLETAELNVVSQSRPVYYWYNESSEEKVKYRCEDFPALIQAQKEGRFFPVMQTDFEFYDVLQPEAINLVDYIDFNDDFFLIGQTLRKLYNVLTTGIVIFGLQKNPGQVIGYGGILSVKLSNLYVTLSRIEEGERTFQGKARIYKCKDWAKLDTNPCGLVAEYATGGRHGKLFLKGQWHRERSY